MKIDPSKFDDAPETTVYTNRYHEIAKRAAKDGKTVKRRELNGVRRYALYRGDKRISPFVQNAEEIRCYIIYGWGGED